MAGQQRFVAPSIVRGFGRGLLRITLPISFGALGVYSILLWLVLSRLAGGEVAFIAAVATVGGSVVTLVVQVAVQAGGEVFTEATKRLRLAEVIYVEVEDNGLLATELSKQPLKDHVEMTLAIRPLSDKAWLHSKADFGFMGGLSDPREVRAHGDLYARLSAHYEMVAAANRELALRERCLLLDEVNANRMPMIDALDQDLHAHWKAIVEQAPETLKLFPDEVRNLIVHAGPPTIVRTGVVVSH